MLAGAHQFPFSFFGCVGKTGLLAQTKGTEKQQHGLVEGV